MIFFFSCNVYKIFYRGNSFVFVYMMFHQFHLVCNESVHIISTLVFIYNRFTKKQDQHVG